MSQSKVASTTYKFFFSFLADKIKPTNSFTHFDWAYSCIV